MREAIAKFMEEEKLRMEENITRSKSEISDFMACVLPLHCEEWPEDLVTFGTPTSDDDSEHEDEVTTSG